MKTYIIKGGTTINEGQKQSADILIRNGRIDRIDPIIDAMCPEIIAEGKIVMPGIIDDQVHFREPGLTHKGTIYTEAKAAVAGGTTSFMEMPNTKPSATTQLKLEDKYNIARHYALANHSFFMGASNENYDEAMKTNLRNVCGLKIFMGSSTGNMLVDDRDILSQLFANFQGLIATHCEDEATIRANKKTFQEEFGDQASASHHPRIRSREACMKSSSLAIELAKKYSTRLHILHISTGEEVQLFDNDLPLKDKKITSEVCVHHLSFNSRQYENLGNKIVCNPAIKEETDRIALWKGLLDGHLDIIATDHAPHTMSEKSQHYWEAPSGLPLVQHSLHMMLNHYHDGRISLEQLVDKMCHAPAVCFKIEDRGFLREGYWADIVVVDPNEQSKVNKDNILHKCGWSPLEGQTVRGKINQTFVSGHLAYDNGKFNENTKGLRLVFDR